MLIHFIHHSFHNQTGSSQFMIDILKELGHEVTVYSRESFNVSIGDAIPDLYVLWQADRLLPILKEKQIPILCIPMLDDALPLTVAHFRSVKLVKFVSFSITLHRFLVLSGCNSSYIQFWPKIEEVDTVKDHSIFFWERNPSHLNLNDIIRNLKDLDIPILVRQRPDPHDQLIVTLREGNDKITFLEDRWTTREEFIDLVSKSQVFISPRPWEGIGLSFLEAMALGCCVLAFNNPTMNEYIKSGKTGILIKNRTAPFDLSDAKEIGIRARDIARQGSLNFQKSAFEFFSIAIDAALNGATQRRFKLLPSNLTLRKYIFLKRLR